MDPKPLAPSTPFSMAKTSSSCYKTFCAPLFKLPIFHNIFLNTDISFNISNTALKFKICNLCDVLEGRVSLVLS